MKTRKCPFYGFHQTHSLLIDSQGNQCALNKGYAPCQMEISCQSPDWETCLYNTSAQILENFRNFQVFPKEQMLAGQESNGISFNEWLKLIKNSE